MKKARKNRESGQAMLEYIMLLMITVGFLVAFLRQATSTLDTGTLTLGGKIEAQMRTGRVPASIWTK